MVVMSMNRLEDIRAWALIAITSPVWLVIGLALLVEWLFPIPREWTPWFAWRPVRCGGEVVWLERVERREFFDLGGMCYRRAQGIEAGTDETRSGSAEGESPVAKQCAQPIDKAG